jgi:hypothetical protein
MHAHTHTHTHTQTSKRTPLPRRESKRNRRVKKLCCARVTCRESDSQMRLCKGKCWARVVCSINTKLVASVGEVESISPKLRACDGARHAQLSVSHTARNVALQRTQNRNVATTKNVGQRHKVSSHACGAQCRDAWPAARLPQVKHACGCRFEQGLTASGNAPVVAVAVAVGAAKA